jgi:hypothetical protein
MCNEIRRRIAPGQMREHILHLRIPLTFREGAPNLAATDSIRITDPTLIVRASTPPHPQPSPTPLVERAYRIRRSFMSRLSLLALVSVPALALGACSQKTQDAAGSTANSAYNDSAANLDAAGNAADNAGDAAAPSLDRAGDAAANAASATGDANERAGNSISNAAH